MGVALSGSSEEACSANTHRVTGTAVSTGGCAELSWLRGSWHLVVPGRKGQVTELNQAVLWRERGRARK